MGNQTAVGRASLTFIVWREKKYYLQETLIDNYSSYLVFYNVLKMLVKRHLCIVYGVFFL